MKTIQMIAKLGLYLCLLISAVNHCVNATVESNSSARRIQAAIRGHQVRQDHTVKPMDIEITCDDHGHGFCGAYDAESYTSMQVYETDIIDIIREAILDSMPYGQDGPVGGGFCCSDAWNWLRDGRRRRG